MNKEEIITKIVGKKNYLDCKKMDEDNIKEVAKELVEDGYFVHYRVRNDSNRFWGYYYDVAMINDFKGNIECQCDCSDYYKSGKCVHIGAVLYNYFDEIIDININDIMKDKTKKIFNMFDISPSKIYNKEELKLEIEIGLNQCVSIKIGIDKLYVLKNKVYDFLQSYYNYSHDIEFGKNFVYNPDKYYFNKEDEKIINYLYDRYLTKVEYTSKSNFFNFNDGELKSFLRLIDTRIFTIKDVGKIYKIHNEFPLSSSISKDNDNYSFKFNIEDSLYALTSDFEYIVYKGELYHLNKKEKEVLKYTLGNKMDSLLFTKNELDIFNKTILPCVKDKTVVDTSADDIVIVKKPLCKLYFDILYNDIVCNIKLIYGENEIDYFDKTDNILRDIDYEKEIVSDIINCGFIEDKKRYRLSDDEEIGYFLEYSLKDLTEKYETFTSQKLKNINVVKNTKVTSTFSIGKDNIMKFNFDLGDITADELDNIFSNLKKNKKYYKLRSGDFINLDENNELRQLESLSNELELSSKDIKKGKGKIDKYRAIYLDSIKDDKYDIIKTNNIFNEFINKFKNYKNAELEFTKEEEDTLRDYQKIGVKWLYNICKCDLGGILADEMGLGKSMQVLIFLRKILKEEPESKFLVVVPTSLVYNWENEILKFTPEINYQIFAGNKEKRIEKYGLNPNLYITSYGILREDFEYIEDINFRVMVIDEAQSIKNPTAMITKKVKSVKAETKIALTGTPIENSVSELWSIFDYIMPGFFASIITFQKKYNVKDFNEESNKRLDVLNKQISPFILRRKKKDVLNDLPDKIENNIIVELSDSEKRLYAKEVERVRKEIDELVSTSGWQAARFKLVVLITKLRQLCIDPSIVYDNYKEESTKMERLIKLVKDYKENGHKMLIFTSFRTALNIMQEKLSNNGISSYVIAGDVSSKKRMELVDKFNSDDTDVFLIMLKAGGTGLNLTSADVVIHLDIWWNPQAENQATDRAHRIGQKNTVEVIKLISNGTIEERILELQEKKKTLSDKLIEGEERDQNLINKLSEEDIKNLLSYGEDD